jgi:methyl-accepting chemotaxis protein
MRFFASSRSASSRGLSSDRGTAVLVVLGAVAVQFAAGAVVAVQARHARALPLLATAAVAVIAGGLLGASYVISVRRSHGRVRQLQSVLDAANRGDLTASVNSRYGDDLAGVENGVDHLVAQLTKVGATVQQVLGRLQVARLSAAEVHKEMLDVAELTAGQAYDAGASAEQVSDNVQSVASATEELAATVNDIARHATLAADVAVNAAAESGVADNGVRELSVALNQVEDIANVISAIARQTHLLALNATIEAARAGDVGLGFAVVAAEVKELAKATADATEQVHAILVGIQEGSGRASSAIGVITNTMSQICESTSSIAAAVLEQSETTQEIGRVSGAAAMGAQDISRRVSAVHDRAREVAYVGARTDAAKSEEIALLEDALRAAVAGLDVGGYVATIGSTDVEVDQAHLNEIGTTTTGNVTTVLHNVLGTGLREFDYTGAWLHGNGYETDPGGDAYSSVAGDEVRLRFVGTRLRFTGCKDKQQGMAEVWVDHGEPALIDFYSPDRAHTMLWESAELATGEHTFHLRVSQKKNPSSRYFWVSVAKVEIVH